MTTFVRLCLLSPVGSLCCALCRCVFVAAGLFCGFPVSSVPLVCAFLVSVVLVSPVCGFCPWPLCFPCCVCVCFCLRYCPVLHASKIFGWCVDAGPWILMGSSWVSAARPWPHALASRVCGGHKLSGYHWPEFTSFLEVDVGAFGRDFETAH